MMARIIISLIVLQSLLFQGCYFKSSETTNSQSQVKKIGKFSFKLITLRSDKLVSMNYDSSNSISKAERDSIVKEYEDYQCFIFEINIDGYSGDIVDFEEGSPSDYNTRLNYYLSDMQNDLVLKDDKGNQQPCTVYYFQRLNELAKTNKFIVGFKKIKCKDITFQYTNSLLKCGTINFSLNTINI